MSVLVTGSIAIDQIMVFQDRFKNHILPDKIHTLNVAFTVPELERRWGGTAANIAYNLRKLEADPILLATVGQDFAAYAEWLDGHGVARDAIRVLEDCFTAQCFITTDLDNNQITSFHAGAMDRAHEAPISGLDREIGLGIVAPNGKRAMIEHANTLRERGIPWLADPGQGLPMFDQQELIDFLEGATVYIVNDYEMALTLERTGLSEDELAARVGAVVVTRGAEGSRIRRGGLESGLRFEADTCEIPVVTPARVADPTGCGDAYRAGVLYGLANGMTLEQGARAGSLMGSLKVAEQGPQSIEIDLAGFRSRFEAEFGLALG
jgi:adenosine kinase